MTAFVDTSFFVAFLSARDRHHQRARDVMADRRDRMVTTAWVLTELGNFVARTAARHLFVPFVRDLKNDVRMTVMPSDDRLFIAGINLYESRRDKTWSVTDCVSFVVMQEQGITEALTADHHFEQAGFAILLK